jgi:hypothetical protein
VEGLKSPKKHKKPCNLSSPPSSSAKKRASFSEKLILMPELKFVFQLSSIDPHGKLKRFVYIFIFMYLKIISVHFCFFIQYIDDVINEDNYYDNTINNDMLYFFYGLLINVYLYYYYNYYYYYYYYYYITILLSYL